MWWSQGESNPRPFECHSDSLFSNYFYPLALESFEAKWSKQYPQIAKSWYVHWENLMVFLGYPEAIRKVIYTTNSVESVNSQLRKVTKNKRVFPNDNAVFKTLYLAID
ncbi:transposase [Rickettsia parkeri]|uniref:transposase n=1 Tax=Rickettsia parkeri TaxID=35792 RepID=UPI001C998288